MGHSRRGFTSAACFPALPTRGETTGALAGPGSLRRRLAQLPGTERGVKKETKPTGGTWAHTPLTVLEWGVFAVRGNASRPWTARRAAASGSC